MESTLVVKIDGMSCQHCVRHVTRALEGIPGTTLDKVVIGSATLKVAEGVDALPALRAALEKKGYTLVG